MSKRYGRNQKRRAREQIADLRESLAMTEGLTRLMGNKLRAANRKVQDMVEVIESVCKHSVALPPREIKDQIDRDHYDVPGPRSPLVDSFVIPGNVPLHAVTFKVIDTHALRVFVEERREAMGAAIHLVYSGGGRSSYFISQQALAGMPNREMMERLVPDIARCLTNYLRKDRLTKSTDR